jgi:hypothetical protein
MDSGLGQFGTRHDDDEAPQAFRRGEHMGRVGFDPPSFFPLDGRSPVSHPTRDVPFPPRRTGGYRKGMISARPLATPPEKTILGKRALICRQKRPHM